MAETIDETTASPEAQPSTTMPPSNTVGAGSYTPEAMRAVLTALREEAATRAALEKKIASEYEQGCEATRQEADRLIQETIDRYDDKIASTKREFASLQQKVEAQFRETEAKIQQQRDAKASQITQQADRIKEQLKEDEHFAESTQAESFKERRRDPGKLFTRDSQQLETFRQEFVKLREKCVKILAERKVEATDVAPADAPDPLPTGKEILAHVAELRQSLIDGVKSLAGLTAAKAGAGMLNVFGRTKLLQEASQAAFAELERDFQRATAALEAAAAFLTARRDEQQATLEQAYKDEVTRRKQRLADDVAKAAAKRDAELAALEEKATAALTAADTKRAGLLEEANAKYPPAIEALETQRAERMRTIETKRDERLAELESRRGSRWQEMVERWKRARESAAKRCGRLLTTTRRPSLTGSGWPQMMRPSRVRRRLGCGLGSWA